MKIKILLLSLMAGSLFISSCEDKKDDEVSPIVGNWEVVLYYLDYSDCSDDELTMNKDGRDTIDWNNGEYMKFNVMEDGTLTRIYDMSLGEVSNSGTWELEGDLFTFILYEDGNPREETVTLDFADDGSVTFTSEVDDCHISGTKTWSFVLEKIDS